MLLTAHRLLLPPSRHLHRLKKERRGGRGGGGGVYSNPPSGHALNANAQRQPFRLTATPGLQYVASSRYGASHPSKVESDRACPLHDSLLCRIQKVLIGTEENAGADALVKAMSSGEMSRMHQGFHFIQKPAPSTAET